MTAMKILVATEKPFAAAAVNGIREIAQAGGHEVVLLEKYTSADQLMKAVADAGSHSRSLCVPVPDTTTSALMPARSAALWS